eukprot:TRINITY_DN3729_c0_g1_i1.p1 TRINITY_DN3729_c0_g1~~TRINITY_DN3729_c0_g1_i1.p1  ORF type:complete len:436 (+),score=133.44 TRINITY_DN3729_c0_g1_i1:51-1358(+)
MLSRLGIRRVKRVPKKHVISGVSKAVPMAKIVASSTARLAPISLNAFGSLSLKKNQVNYQSFRFYSSGEPVSVELPSMGESILEGTVFEVLQKPGDFVEMDDIVVSVSTEKVTFEVRAPQSGTIKEIFVAEDDEVEVGQAMFTLQPGEGEASKPAEKEEAATEKKEEAAPEKKEKKEPAKETKKESTKESKKEVTPAQNVVSSERTETRKKMIPMRKAIAQRLKDSQNTAAMLTTFNEVDMYNIMNLRKSHKDAFLEKHGVKLGFMSAFVKASVAALQEYPTVNAVIDGNDIVYRNYNDISVAVATPNGLVVPVLRDCQNMSFADVEKGIAALGKKARDGKIATEDMLGGTFTISNGGVYGSLMGTPIINPPQSAILGMHGINDKPHVVDGEIKIRPIMFVALTYDHRIIDGREAVLFLKKIKTCIENPETLLLE